MTTMRALLVGLLLVTLSGCGSGLIATMRTVRAIGGLALNASRGIAAEASAAALADCAPDEEGVAPSGCAEHEDAAKAADVAIDLADATLIAFDGVIDAIAAIGDGNLMGAAGTASLALLRSYERVRESLCRLGYRAWEVPSAVPSLIAWLTGEMPELQPIPACEALEAAR